MKHEQVHSLTESFEGHAQETENGVEYWLARDLQQLLGYSEWRNFVNVITKAKTACEVSGREIGNHFVDVNKMVDLGSGSQREISDIMLTRLLVPKRRLGTRSWMRRILHPADRGAVKTAFPCDAWERGENGLFASSPRCWSLGLM